MLREGIRLSRRHRRLLYGIGGVLWASGALWLLFHYVLQTPGEFGDTPHPLEPWSLRVHGLAAMLALLVLGSLVRGHIRMGWNVRRNRLSGAILVGANCVLIATGWGLYYVSSEIARPWISLVHWTLGLALAVAVAAHVFLAARSGRLARAPSGATADSGDTRQARAIAPAARQVTSS
jgi:hypothetical protein